MTIPARTKEKQLLAAAGLDTVAKPWEGFASTGGGMGLTLQVAGERRAYALSDIGTFLAYRERTKPVRLTKDAPALRNEYSVLRISPKRFPKRRAEAAQRFEAFLVDPDTQRRIGEFGRDRYGAPLFNSLHNSFPPLAKEPARPVTELPRAELLEITLRSLGVCGSALALALVLGLPLGIALGRRQFPGAAPRSWRS